MRHSKEFESILMDYIEDIELAALRRDVGEAMSFADEEMRYQCHKHNIDPNAIRQCARAERRRSND